MNSIENHNVYTLYIRIFNTIRTFFFGFIATHPFVLRQNNRNRSDRICCVQLTFRILKTCWFRCDRTSESFAFRSSSECRLFIYSVRRRTKNKTHFFFYSRTSEREYFFSIPGDIFSKVGTIIILKTINFFFFTIIRYS